jgi:hypothetical protein
MFATEWCFTLFGSIVPVDVIGDFLDMFVDSGWISLYKLILVIIDRIEAAVLEKDDIGDILCLLKPSHKSQNDWKFFLSSLERRGETLDWRGMFKASKQVDLDEAYIRHLHMNFNLETCQFSNVLSD